MSGPLAGKYDPRIASIYGLTRGKSSTGEPTQSLALYCKRYIKFKTMYSREQIVQNQTQSTNMIVIRIHRDRITEAISADMVIVHPTGKWGIVGINPVPNEQGECEFQCQAINLPTP